MAMENELFISDSPMKSSVDLGFTLAMFDETRGYPSSILVGGIPTPLKNMGSSIGMMTFPIYMESHKRHVPVTTNQT